MTNVRVAIVDSGGANTASLTNALDRLAVANMLTTSVRDIQTASHVIIPGVGAAADAMRRLDEHRLSDTIANLQQPVLGICLGMQLLANVSAEGNVKCLGLVDANVEKLAGNTDFPVPNMGWCRVTITNAHPLLSNIDNHSYFYFVHSFIVPNGDYTLATAEHRESFTAVLGHRNFYATQFHPERSALAGARLLQNFIALTS